MKIKDVKVGSIIKKIKFEKDIYYYKITGITCKGLDWSINDIATGYPTIQFFLPEDLDLTLEEYNRKHKMGELYYVGPDKKCLVMI